jgi:3-hydroxyisobutyrate dehydrogenase
MGTSGIEGIDRWAELAEKRGLVLVDTPVSGTKQPAEQGELVVMASGAEDVRERVKPIFDAVGMETMWVGAERGAGSRLKVVVNGWIVTVVEGAAEMLALAEALGLDLPYLQMKGKAMLERDFTTSFRLALAAKDADLAVRAAASAELELPMLKAISRRFARRLATTATRTWRRSTWPALRPPDGRGAARRSIRPPSPPSRCDGGSARSLRLPAIV